MLAGSLATLFLLTSVNNSVGIIRSCWCVDLGDGAICSALLIITFVCGLTILVMQIFLKAFSFTVHKIPFYCSDLLSNLFVWLKSLRLPAEEGTKDLLYAFLSRQEKASWEATVDPYIHCVASKLAENSFLQFSNLPIYQSSLRQASPTPTISYLHTGSIPSQFGKPVMLLEGLDRLVSHSFPHLSSDHDLMFVLDHLPVQEEMVESGTPCIWLLAELMQSVEFVRVIVMESDGDRSRPVTVITNREASDYLKRRVVATFFTDSGAMTPAARQLPVVVDQLDLCSCLSRPFYQETTNKVLITRAGPSVNMKVTAQRGQLVFDCDFLLSLPLSSWPSPAQEWRARERLWPSRVQVERLASLPCHLVPKPASEFDTLSWRFSFSAQEIQLSSMLPLEARLCYVGLKHIFKKHLKTISPDLKSYHMLTIFLWFMESQDPKCWIEDDQKAGDCIITVQSLSPEESEKAGPKHLPSRSLPTLHMLSSLLGQAAQVLESLSLPHYFISSLNLLKISGVLGDGEKEKQVKAVAWKLRRMVMDGGLEALLRNRMARHGRILHRDKHWRVVEDRGQEENLLEEDNTR